MRNHLLNRLELADYLIRSGATGTPSELAKRLSISERALYDFLDFMKSMGAPICYSRAKRTYYYSELGSLSLRFRKWGEEEPESSVAYIEKVAISC